MTDARNLIMGTSSPSFSFNYRGDKIVGKVITEPKAVQQTVYNPNATVKELAFWPSGDPKMQVVFQVETAWRNYEGINSPDRTKPDNGVRTIYLKGKHMEKATADAIRAAGADWIEVGGMISFEYTGDDLQSKAGIKPKLFAVKYRSPDPQVSQAFGNNNGYPNQGYGQQRGYGDQSYPQQQPPRPPQAAQNPAQAYAQYQATQQRDPGPVNPGPYGVVGVPQSDPWATPAPVAPPHHGQPDAMPEWATPTSAPPASAPPALSTLDMIKQAGQSDSGGFGSVEPAF